MDIPARAARAGQRMLGLRRRRYRGAKGGHGTISELGGRVNFKRGGYEVDLTKTPVEDKDLAHLKQIPNLKNVDLQGTRITDAGLAHLGGIETLELVYLQRTIITPEGLEQFKKSLPKAEVNY